MIIQQTTTLIFQYPQDYMQEQEWCKTKGDRWIHKGTDTLGAVYENQISYSIGASVSVKTEPQTCDTCKFADKEWYEEPCNSCGYMGKYEPQTDCSWR